MAAGIPAENISLSTQELPSDFADLIEMGVKVNAWYVFRTQIHTANIMAAVATLLEFVRIFQLY
jgi:hypothetical protein